jgi:hypothetical protein
MSVDSFPLSRNDFSISLALRCLEVDGFIFTFSSIRIAQRNSSKILVIKNSWKMKIGQIQDAGWSDAD